MATVFEGIARADQVNVACESPITTGDTEVHRETLSDKFFGNLSVAVPVFFANGLLCGSSIEPEGVKTMKTQAWGWLAAAVMAAGLNASYHDGGLRWAHEIANQVKHNTGAVLALATGRADQFVTEANLVAAAKQSSPCPLAAALAEARTVVVPTQVELRRFDVMSAREQAKLARVEAERARIRSPRCPVAYPGDGIQSGGRSGSAIPLSAGAGEYATDSGSEDAGAACGSCRERVRIRLGFWGSGRARPTSRAFLFWGIF